MSTVARPERTRLLEAMLEELVEKGYPALEIEDALQRAKLAGGAWSTRSLDKDACLLEAFEGLAGQMRAAILEGCRGGGTRPERIAAGLRALLAELGRRAPMAEALARAFPAIGPAAMVHYQAFIESLAPLLTSARKLADGIELPTEVEMLAVGAAEAIVMERIQAGAASSLPELGPEILFSLLVPFCGPEAATEAMVEERSRLSAAAGHPESV
jgi:AcrR family transcriptional regulator